MLLNRLLSATVRYCGSLRAQYSTTATGMDLKIVVAKLKQLAPCSLAEDWDNVGLLVEPSSPHLVNSILLTNDLTDAVVEEAKEMVHSEEKVDLIVSYHPPIFKPLKRLTQSSAKERMIVWALENRVAIYSPHTSCDSVWHGVNDWLVSGCGEGVVTPLRVKELPAQLPHTLVIQGSGTDVKRLAEEVVSRVIPGAGSLSTTTQGDTWALELGVPSSALTIIMPKLPQALPSCSISVKPSPKVLSTGPGRQLTLSSSITLHSLISRIKQHLGLSHLRLALPLHSSMESSVSTIAVCAGSGASLLRGVRSDVYLTGEMSHHEVLEATAAGSSVILTEHSNSERGYLRVLKEQLEKLLDGDVKIKTSSSDKDPLSVV